MIKRDHLLAVCSTFLIVGLAGCGQMPAVSHENADQYSQVVASADNGLAMTMQNLYERLRTSRLHVSGGLVPPSEVRQFLEEQLVDTLAGFMADSIDIGEHYDYKRLYQLRYYDFMLEIFAREFITGKAVVDSSEVIAFYDKNMAMFEKPEQVDLYHILAAIEGLRNGPDSMRFRSTPVDQRDDAVKEYANRLKDLLDEGRPFTEVAAMYSHDAKAPVDSGHTGWVARGVYGYPFDSIAFALEPGSYSDVYWTSNGCHIIYVAAMDTGGFAPLDSNLFEQIKGHLVEQKANELARPILDSVEQEINLVYNEPALDTNVYLIDKTIWAGVLNGRDTIDFNEVRALEERYRKQYGVVNTTVEMKRQMIHDLARRYILVQAARAGKIDTIPEVMHKDVSLRHQYGKAIVLKRINTSEWQPPDSVVTVYYENHLLDYEIDKPLRVQHIISEDSSFAIFLRDQALAGTDFLELARQYYPGEESIRVDLADLGWIGPKDVSPEFWGAAQVTSVGTVTYPVKTEYGYHIIKVLERKPQMSMGQARHEIIPRLREEHKQKVWERFRDELYSMYNVRFPGRVNPVMLRPLGARVPITELGF